MAANVLRRNVRKKSNYIVITRDWSVIECRCQHTSSLFANTNSFASSNNSRKIIAAKFSNNFREWKKWRDEKWSTHTPNSVFKFRASGQTVFLSSHSCYFYFNCCWFFLIACCIVDSAHAMLGIRAATPIIVSYFKEGGLNIASMLKSEKHNENFIWILDYEMSLVRRLSTVLFAIAPDTQRIKQQALVQRKYAMRSCK